VMSVSDRLREIADLSKAQEDITRDLVSSESPSTPGRVMPYAGHAFVTVKPSQGGDYRKTWEKCNQPV
jgi:hypothetical protein